jgi:hypothetical protein
MVKRKQQFIYIIAITCICILFLSGCTSNDSFRKYSSAAKEFNKIYFGQGTVTNSGVVGLDNLWVENHPYLHDKPGSYVLLNGQNFASKNMLSETSNDITYTGAFSSYGEPNDPHEIRKGVIKASVVS